MKAGIVAGLGGGVVFGMSMAMMGMLPMVAGLVKSDNPIVGLGVHMVISAFINGGGAEIDRTADEVRLSKIFQWYAPDFGGHPLGMGNKRSLLKFIASYLNDVNQRAYLLEGHPKVRFSP